MLFGKCSMIKKKGEQVTTDRTLTVEFMICIPVCVVLKGLFTHTKSKYSSFKPWSVKMKNSECGT